VRFGRARSTLVLAVLPAVVALVAACGAQGRAGPPTPETDLTVFAAAYALAPHPARLAVSTDSSAALEAKLEQGAAADLFLSADTSNPARLAAAGLTAGDPVPFAGNRLAVVTPPGNPAAIGSPADLARAGVKVVAAGDAVPISEYARRLVANLAREPAYPTDFAGRYAANVVSKEDNVGAVLSKVELGEADAGIVYATDAEAAGPKVHEVAVPDRANVLATYAGAVLRASPRADAARAFLAWLAGPDGQAVLGPLGFTPPTGAPSAAPS
jgi:molybdate transport system substrate-binding protein